MSKGCPQSKRFFPSLFIVLRFTLLAIAFVTGCGGGGGSGTVLNTSTEFTVSGNVLLPQDYSASATASILAQVPANMTARVVDAADTLQGDEVSVNQSNGQFSIPRVKPGARLRIWILTGGRKIILQKFFDSVSADRFGETVDKQTTAVAILAHHSNGSRTASQVEAAVNNGSISLNALLMVIDSFLKGSIIASQTNISEIVVQSLGTTGISDIIGRVPATSNPGTASGTGNQYTLAQAMSDNAQLSTIAFSGLAFITGNGGADTFFPPGKVADFFGFQYMRDVDVAGYGHNTTFLTRVAANVLYILNDSQKAKLVALAKTQAPIYVNFAYNRFPLMNAFRRCLEGRIPTGTVSLSSSAVSAFTSNLYKWDADLSYNRALVVGEIINSFTTEQKAYLSAMQFNNFSTWPAVAEDETLKKSMTNNEFIAVMTYASELFSWYKGNPDADVYFCPERHGTYFGGFFMKDYPAMNNPDYFISTAITGDSGKEFLNILDAGQKALITGIIDEQRASLAEIAQIRTTISAELRKAISGGTIDREKVYSLIQRYGELDGQMSALYATRFSAVRKTLTETQMAALVNLRNLNVVPQGAYRFSAPVAMPTLPDTDFLFGVGTPPQDAGLMTAPTSLANSSPPGVASRNSRTIQPVPKKRRRT